MTPKIFESEYRFCLILWEHEPIKSTDLAKLCKTGCTRRWICCPKESANCFRQFTFRESRKKNMGMRLESAKGALVTSAKRHFPICGQSIKHWGDFE